MSEQVPELDTLVEDEDLVIDEPDQYEPLPHEDGPQDDVEDEE